ncbi:hypothetical protein D7294_30565 [Streptomyces hoynatensis]|uniref:Uncharacterized protein n=1 Tax=Streptomyces hoynatensis TaxID=1141874 RepID=A0A3A9YN11_9ACTN|nr:hypothetical protein D7294_30565 [Streptomyces hoynatensis]
MTGPEHYKRAEECIELAATYRQDAAREALMEAQVHATLALAAVTACQAPVLIAGKLAAPAGLSEEVHLAWAEAAG